MTVTITESPGASTLTVAGLGAPTLAMAPVREVVKSIPGTLLVQLFFTLNLTRKPEMFPFTVIGVGLRIVARTGLHETANAGCTPVGVESSPEQASATHNNTGSPAVVRILRSFT
jgi:hypothetical protein